MNLSDGYCAARFLCPEFIHSLQQKLTPKVYVAIPARDFLVAWTEGFSESSLIMRQAGELYAEMDHPLTREIFVLEKDRFRLATADELDAMSRH